MGMVLRIGELLVRRGVLTGAQRDEILTEQARSGRPFGDLAERLFDVCPRDVEQAWAEQYASMVEPIDARVASVEPDALAMVTHRQAWQFAVLPLRFASQELVACTTQTHLARALRFAAWRIALPVRFVLSDPMPLGDALCAHYHLPGMRAEDLLDATGARAATLGGAIEDLDLAELA